MANDHQYGGKPRSDAETKDRTGRQSPQQAVFVEQGGGGMTDAERSAMWTSTAHEPGRSPVSVGGASQGRSDQSAGQGPDEDRKVAGGLYRNDWTVEGDAAVPTNKPDDRR